MCARACTTTRWELVGGGRGAVSWMKVAPTRTVCGRCHCCTVIPRRVPLVALFVASALLSGSNGPKAPPVWQGGWPVVGHFLSFAANPLATIRRGYGKLGNVFTMKFMNYNLTFLVGPNAHTPFFRANDEELSQNEPYKFMTPIFGRGIVFDAPQEVKDQQLRFVAGA